ncbi:hypothetical protein ACTA71_001212 [Dictyostelium dimigraforme]
MLTNKVLLLFVILSLAIFKNVDAGYSLSVKGKKLQYTGADVDYKITEMVINSQKILPDYSITFTCDTSNVNTPVCTSGDLDLTKLAGMVTIKGAKLKTPTVIIVLDNKIYRIPFPEPTEIKWEPPTLAGSPALMTGDFLLFGEDVSSLNGVYNSKSVSLGVTSNTDATKITVKSPGGYGNMKVIFGSSQFTVNFSSPIVSSVAITNSLITITGQNFWIDKKVVNVKLGQDDISSSITSSDTSKIVINYDSKYSSNSSVLVTVGGNSQTTPYYVSIPSLPQSIDKAVSKGTGGLITISGKCLKGSGPSVTSVLIGAYTCAVVGTQISSDLMCQLPPATKENGSKDLKVVITIDGIKNTNELLYSYGIPQITKIDQKLGTTLFTITGSNLGKTDSIVRALSAGAATPLDLSVVGFDDEKESYLTFNLPTNCSKSAVSVYDGQDTSNNFDLTPNPYIKNLKDSPSTDGEQINFIGGYLDPTAKASITLLDARNQSVDCSDFQVGSDSSSATCKLAPGCGSIKSTILVGDSSMEVDFNYQSPSSLVATQMPNNKLEISGKNLGPNSKYIKLDINGNELVASSLENGTASFDLPSTFLSDSNAIISVDGISNTDSDQLDINLQPVAKSISSSTTSGSTITVTGSFFNSKDNNIKVMVGNQSCNSIAVVNAQTLTCLAPPGSGLKNAVSFLVKDTESKLSSPLFLAYNPPTIMSSTSVKQVEGGQVTIYGTNFEQTLVSVNVGNKSCKDVSVIDSTKLTCSISNSTVDPSLVNKKLAVNVTVNGQSGNGEVFEYDNEALNTETPKVTLPPTESPTETPTESQSQTPSPVEKHTENNSSNIISHSLILIFSLLLIIQII